MVRHQVVPMGDPALGLNHALQIPEESVQFDVVPEDSSALLHTRSRGRRPLVVDAQRSRDRGLRKIRSLSLRSDGEIQSTSFTPHLDPP